jgi:hypothetical protein
VASPRLVVDVYRHHRFVRREIISDLPRSVEIGSAPTCRIRLEAEGVEPVAARLMVDREGGVTDADHESPEAIGTPLLFEGYTLDIVDGTRPAPLPGTPWGETPPLDPEASDPSVSVALLSCAPCALLVVAAGTIGAVTRFRGSRAVLKERAAGVACPRCGAQLFRLVLSMGHDSVALEECNECGSAVVDRGELVALGRIAAELRS